jgi:prepilin-type N-terminal cleavage/methylation domain-containing protein
MRRPRAEGFTLIELIIVIAIIAVIAAIAVPALMASQRSSNERNASTSLKTISTAQADFKGQDRDQNKIRDYWTRDVSGLFTLCPIGFNDPIRLIEITLAGADSAPAGTDTSPLAGSHVAIGNFAASSPKAGYWFLAMDSDDSGNAYRQATGGTAPFDQAWFNTTNYGFLTFPDGKNVGRSMYFVSEDNTVLKRPISGNVRPVGSTPPGSALVASGAVGTAPLLSWPTAIQLKSDYAKLD